MNKHRPKGVRHVGWDDELWDRRFTELVEYREKYGNTRVPVRWRKNASLGRWVAHQRELYRQGQIEPDRAACLEALGLEWERFSVRHAPEDMEHMRAMLVRLAAHRRKHGTANITRETDAPLTRWIETMRRRWREAKLTDDQRELLQQAEFPWARPLPTVEEMLARLGQFKARFGHVQVPARWPEDRALGRWLAHQREMHRWGKLKAETCWRLKALGVRWSWQRPRIEDDEACMEKMLSRLAAARQKSGALMEECRRDPALMAWIRRQRAVQEAGKMPVEHWQRLTAAGFPWKRVTQRVEEPIEKLRAFHARFGHTQVPVRWKEDPQLGRWVEHAREKFRKGKLPVALAKMMDELGFVWQPSTVARPLENQPQTSPCAA